MPVFISESRDLSVPESSYAVSDCSGGNLIVLRSLWGVFQALPRMLVCSQVILFSLLLAGTMGVRCAVVQFSGLLVILVMRSVVVTSGHLRCSRSVRISRALPLRVYRRDRSTQVLFRRAIFPRRCHFFIVFGGSAVCVRGKFVLLCSL